MQEDIPTTPTRDSPENDIVDDNSSLVLSPEYSDDNLNNEEYPMRGYNHGLSSKKKADQNLVNFNSMKDTTPTILFVEKSMTRMAPCDRQKLFKENMETVSDMSLEVGRCENNQASSNPLNSPMKQSEVTSLEQTVGKTLEQLDVNKPLLSKIDAKMTKQSQQNFNVTSPEKRNIKRLNSVEEGLGEGEKITTKKQKLDSPISSDEKSEKSSDNENIEPPAVIEMINNNTDSTPELEAGVIMTNSAETPNVFDYQNSSPISSNHMLSPIIQREEGHSYDSKIGITEDDDKDDDDNDDSEFNNMISKRNTELSNDIHQVNIKMNNLAVDYQKLNKRYLNYHSMVNELQEDLKVSKMKNGELQVESNSQKKMIDPLKTKLQEFVNEIKMMNSNQNLLQTKYDNICSENEIFKKVQEELEQKIVTHQGKIKENDTIIKVMTTEKDELQSKMDKYIIDIEELQQQKEHAELDAESYKSELEIKNLNLLETQQTLNKTVDSEKSNSADLLQNIKLLTEEKEELLSKLGNIEKNNDKEMKEMKDKVETFESTNKELQSKIYAYTSDLETIKENMERKDQEINTIKKQLDSANDECEVRVAEVTELNIEIESLKESKIHLEESNTILKEELNKKNLSSKDEIEIYKKASIELESVQLKNNNVESQYLKEIGELQNTLATVGDSLESAQKQTEQSEEENKKLKEKIEEQKNILFSKEATTSENNIDDLNKQISELKKQLEIATATTTQIDQGTEKNDVEELRHQIDNWKLKMEEKEKDTNKRLRLLAEDLYHQYSSKHEQKVKSLKKSYEKKYETQIEKLAMDNQALKEEIDRINKLLHSEREEKRELLRTMENEAN
ncbi:similar to Saccharomyces cerevisiae YOR195W SLK19 Kinetochore-associated protein required for normal segregation of chromosomes in meiosis and mitosis [Maudiozyma barnettii]|uniref:Similar to Saccharomyces cerevisiae YOR195W SLK19 Kinetochore-associated protein required for normal segregation of chromosomes in meiosis and mitosis n=1 Tax=Maudiozyma barnettii TaxID=61262 RepID=A0A8H2ZH78_9SACH|nr:Slk19p [Kazachstania barnettii]CAB4253653.1 similar to Saccharomyces cerevisiae YOR195W SLK19 Kinetochore-associated protein required for normal segregation of chromosomes in meiosis and mitosis [Kazachstania barnettii]CAD1781340.1 similar to Saccharomyces cerevisiae YOR195W SLK19 Kinetochore-associated protein required for normal segregation of chromosomes in meiosis and mitosis [Kazachstania barnettii]